jgi:hypothetical protein
MRVSKLTNGQVRKLNALRKSLGNKIADPAFSKWLKTQNSNKSGGKPDPVAEKLERSLKSLESKKINLGTWGYTIKRSKGKGAKGFVATRNKKPSKTTGTKKPSKTTRTKKPSKTTRTKKPSKTTRTKKPG